METCLLPHPTTTHAHAHEAICETSSGNNFNFCIQPPHQKSVIGRCNNNHYCPVFAKLCCTDWWHNSKFVYCQRRSDFVKHAGEKSCENWQKIVESTILPKQSYNNVGFEFEWTMPWHTMDASQKRVKRITDVFRCARHSARTPALVT